MNQRKPEWLRVRLPEGERSNFVSRVLKERGLHTVCDEARCPNKGECWGSGTATFIILGTLCTRNCRFCAVDSARIGQAVDSGEAERIARVVEELGLRYVVLTSVDRDDLPDRGASHFALCVDAIRSGSSGASVETLIPDYDERELEPLVRAGPQVIAHNVETVPRLQSVRDARASWEKSIATIRAVAAAGITAKSSILLGLGETEDETLAALAALREAGCVSVVLGQYLQPTLRQLPVAEYLTPERFKRYAESARALGFEAVVSSPLARTSYHAREGYELVASRAVRAP